MLCLSYMREYCNRPEQCKANNLCHYAAGFIPYVHTENLQGEPPMKLVQDFTASVQQNRAQFAKEPEISPEHYSKLIKVLRNLGVQEPEFCMPELKAEAYSAVLMKELLEVNRELLYIKQNEG